jgi:putative addiction module killer protein
MEGLMSLDKLSPEGYTSDEEEIVVLSYKTISGTIPFDEWFNSLRESKTKSIIDLNIRKLCQGIYGNVRSIGDGIFELKIHFGPGYRIYYTQDGKNLILLLNGGDKGTQQRDILKAKEYAADYWRRKL